MSKTITELDLEIDKLINSIENTVTGEVFDTRVDKILWPDRHLVNRSDWVFDWNLELRDPKKEVVKLTSLNNPDIVHGLMCFEDRQDHIFLNLLESAKFNKGKRNSISA